MLWLEPLWHSFLVNIAIRNVQALKTEILKILEIYASQPGMSLSYREIIEYRYIEPFRISKSISYRTSNIEYLDILKASDLFCLFPPKIPKILQKFGIFTKNFAETSSKRRSFLRPKYCINIESCREKS